MGQAQAVAQDPQAVAQDPFAAYQAPVTPPQSGTDPFAQYQKPAPFATPVESSNPSSASLFGAGGNEPTLGGLGPTVSNTITHLKNLVSSPYHAAADPATDQETADIQRLGGTPDAVGRFLYRAFMKPTVEGLRTFQQQRAAHNTSLTASEYDAAGNYTPTAASGLMDALPIVGPLARNIDTEAHQQGVFPALAGGAVDILAPIGAAKALHALNLPKVNSLTTPEEAASYRITKAVQPIGTPDDASHFASDVQSHFGDVADYARRTHNPLVTQQDYVKAARGAAEEAAGHYSQNIVAPNAYRTVPITKIVDGQAVPYSATEVKMAEGRPGFASIGDIDQRLRDINAEEKSLQGKPMGDAVAAKRLMGLSSEKGALMDTLHNSLSQMTGITPEEIQALRQKSAGLHNIGDTMNSAYFRRLVTPDAGTVPGTKVGMLAKGMNKLLGGANKIADRRLVKATQNLPMVGTELPPVTAAPPTTNPSADLEFLHAHELEQQAQAAADARAARAAAARQGRVATQSAQAKLEGESARTIGRDRARAASATIPSRSLPKVNP